jgi:hypothetical protein
MILKYDVSHYEDLYLVHNYEWMDFSVLTFDSLQELEEWINGYLTELVENDEGDWDEEKEKLIIYRRISL